MPTTMLGAIRKRLLTPPTSEVSFAVRGFDTTAPAREKLETSAIQFAMGFEIAIEQKGDDSIVTRLECLENEYRGFAYEGAVMALTLRDVISAAPGNVNTERFVSGPGAHQVFMAYIGIGFALARLPKFLWRRALPDQSKLPDHPSLNWMILDGYGFHETFFKTTTWLEQQRLSDRLPWDGPHDYALRVIDQGVGRAMWFVFGGDVDRLTHSINSFPEHRRSDLWSGAALAATYAGGVDDDALVEFVKNSWEYHPEVAQGAVFALKQRVLSGLVTDHSTRASGIICELPPEQASEIADRSVIGLPETSSTPPYELFRQRIQQHFKTR